MTPTASVVICAYTEARWDSLAAAAEAARVQGATEVLLVADHADELLERAARELPGVRAIPNEGPSGLSAARNSGIAAAGGDVVVFLDDDAVPAPGWLARLLAPYERPEVLGVGGTARPAFEEGRPAFLAPEYDWVVGCTYRGLPEHRSQVRNMIGANMSFRREAFAIAGGFRTGLGRVGTLPLGCEETELCIRLRRCRPDAEIVFEPAAVVDHVVPGARGTWAYFIRRCWSEGRSKALVAQHAGADRALASERAHLARALPRGIARDAAGTITGDDPAGVLKAASSVIGVAIAAAGYARESGMQRRRPLCRDRSEAS